MKLAWQKKPLIRFIALNALIMLSGCGSNHKESDFSAADVPQTSVKNQEIENCWAFAIAGWAESLHLRATGEHVNISEAYWTYWQMYDQLVNNREPLKYVNTGAYWATAKVFIADHGLMYERDFSTADQEDLQDEAETAVNKALKRGGLLNEPKNRTPENVISVLDKAFHVQMKDKGSKVVDLKDFIIGAKNDPKQPRNLWEALSDPKRMWKLYEYPYTEGRAKPTLSQQQSRKELLKRVMKAMNQGYPVIMGMMVDANALNERTSTYEYARLKASKPSPDNQGGHMVVLSDYAVKNAPDGHGGTIDVGEGPVSEEERDLAVNGDVVDFVVKNSWGPSKAPGLKSGYYRFEMEYLNAAWKWFNEDGKTSLTYTTLGDFTLPPGFD